MFKKNQRYSFKKRLPAKSVRCDLFSLRFHENDQKKFLCAFVAGSKIDRRSTVRHLIKRRFANALREILKNKNIPYNLVFFINKSSLDKSFQEIKQEITKTFINIG